MDEWLIVIIRCKLDAFHSYYFVCNCLTRGEIALFVKKEEEENENQMIIIEVDSYVPIV